MHQTADEALLQGVQQQLAAGKAAAEAFLTKSAKEMRQATAARLKTINGQMEGKLRQIEDARGQFEATVQKLWGEFCGIYEQLEPAKQVSWIMRGQNHSN